jgi:hypothetical protein
VTTDAMMLVLSPSVKRERAHWNRDAASVVFLGSAADHDAFVPRSTNAATRTLARAPQQ